MRIVDRMGEWLSAVLPEAAAFGVVKGVVGRNPGVVLEAFGPMLNRKPTLATMPFDLEPTSTLGFEHLAGLFASTPLNHGVISMTIRQTAYIFGWARQHTVRKAIEIGRYKGGSTLTIAAAMAGDGDFWSIDNAEKEARLFGTEGASDFDAHIRSLFRRLNLQVNLLVGDSRTIEVETGEVDLVFIDGDHTYEGVRNDFERFGRRARVGGTLFFDDAFHDDLFGTHVESVGRLVHEIEKEGEFKLVNRVDRLAHLERVAPARHAAR